jgi:hypothetical protein
MFPGAREALRKIRRFLQREETVSAEEVGEKRPKTLKEISDEYLKD